VADDAGHGDPGADRLGTLDPDPAGPGRGSAAGVSAPDPASQTSYLAGELPKCDFWFPEVEIPFGFGQVRTSKLLPVLVMVSGYSRPLAARRLPSREAADLFAGCWSLMQQLGGVPKTLVWDGEGAIGGRRGGKVELTGDCRAFRGTLGARVYVRKPADPEAKSSGLSKVRSGRNEVSR
jgi:hypothetical protein